MQAGTCHANRITDGRDRLILTDDPLAQLLLHSQQAIGFADQQTRYGNAGSLRDDGGDVVLGDRLRLQDRCQRGHFIDERRDHAILQFAGAAEVTGRLRQLQLPARIVQLLSNRNRALPTDADVTMPSRPCMSRNDVSRVSRRATLSGSVSRFNALISICIVRICLSISARSCGLLSFSMRSRLADSSNRSMALSGSLRSDKYRLA
ncbi:hypothetical protein PBRA_008326 [Plasmodiophora brassicae]|uniref:Uncharacterized protein n=1 Tax=Plasmodiophora brassicae TaxID=37360 RepID=A0A0G4J0Y0_PLABS|nr:hypothetical protein PBRA_008326 [Plasmodiophora brassicae]